MATSATGWHARHVQRATRQVRVLLVNDSRDEREMYAEWLRRLGYTTLQASNATDGYRMAVELAADVVVTDIKLPGSTDGLELTRLLKQLPATHDVPVLIVSGYVFQAHSDDAAQVGCDRFLTKPCLPETLSAAIEGLLVPKPRKLRHA
jgi:CheY-like chemotaxis protein